MRGPSIKDMLHGLKGMSLTLTCGIQTNANTVATPNMLINSNENTTVQILSFVKQFTNKNLLRHIEIRKVQSIMELQSSE
jgi:hypothetical protein